MSGNSKHALTRFWNRLESSIICEKIVQVMRSAVGFQNIYNLNFSVHFRCTFLHWFQLLDILNQGWVPHLWGVFEMGSHKWGVNLKERWWRHAVELTINKLNVLPSFIHNLKVDQGIKSFVSTTPRYLYWWTLSSGWPLIKSGCAVWNWSSLKSGNNHDVFTICSHQPTCQFCWHPAGSSLR